MSHTIVPSRKRQIARGYPAAVAFCVLLPTAISAQQPLPIPDTLALDDWGVFAARVAKRLAAPDTSAGFREVPGELTLIQESHDVCASLGTQFGFRYHLTGVVPVSELPLTIRIEHPVFAKWNGGRGAVDTISTDIYPGQLHWTGWAFRDPTKLVGGTWTFDVMNQGHILLSQQFRVKTGCTVSIS